MFTNPQQVLEVTGYEVTTAVILRAQAVIETVIGKDESEVVDSRDKLILAKATAFQSAYMRDNADKVYEQIALTYKAQSDAAVTLDATMMAPWVAPLAVLAMRRLSWARTRSISTGPTLHGQPTDSNWRTE
jgi:vacuolar-type H+-ATPase catalytic subunit A/Vma1